MIIGENQETVDFIFGNAAAVFQSDPGQNTGFSIQNSRITGAADFSSAQKSYLGRSWKAYSRAVHRLEGVGPN
ncbi:hypothetical protein SASPL_109694 [Salvia splendens]|uniref:Pectinesterase catalytic domain-containing protein n=1 Tax=Salvia splendens TaxID=180675 RepID=A0A8X8YKG8_SALSN|nr:hypothetical protein SASPL_109694 [Salvia splendens]